MTRLTATRGMVAVCWAVLLAQAAWAGESVLYSMTENSIQYPATNRPVRVLIPESKTEIFAIDPETGGKRLIFSDGNATFMLVPTSGGRGGIVAGGGRIFAVAVDRQSVANGPHSAPAIYELSIDGSNKARKVFDIDNFGNLFVNSSGAKVGYMPGDSTDTHLVIRDTAAGRALRDTEIFSRTIDAEAAGAFGWTPDDRRIFFGLSGGLDDDEALWTTSNSPTGTYVMNADAGTPQRLAPEAALHAKVSGMRPSPDIPAHLIGILPDGGYLLTDSQYNPTGNNGAMYLYSLDLAKKTQRIIPLQVDGGPTSFHLSPANTRLVMTVDARISGPQSPVRTTGNVDVWVLDLESGKQTKLFSFTNTDPMGTRVPWINVIGWLRDE
jgi:hypothetical protein